MSGQSGYVIDVNESYEKWQEALPEAPDICRIACAAALDERHIRDYADTVHVSVSLANDNTMHDLNFHYRDKDKPTNVLSFPLVFLDPNKPEELQQDATQLGIPIMLGDIVLGFETIIREAEEQEKSAADHLAHMVVHATLHLLGYDHIEDEEAEVMEALESKILSSIGIDNPYRAGYVGVKDESVRDEMADPEEAIEEGNYE